MNKIIQFLLVTVIVFSLSACSFDAPANIVMPYSCDEYENGEWTVDELVEHFEKLGFTNIKVANVMESFGEAEVAIWNLTIEDTSSDSWFTEYRTFDKGEEFDSWLEIKIETHTFIPTLTVDNCTDLAELVQTKGSLVNLEDKKSFMESHKNEYIEFEGTITDWYDELHWVGVSFTVSVEDSEYLSFSWETTSLSDLKMEGDYHYSNYKTGLISEGMRVHMIARIVFADNEWQLEINTMNIIE